VTETIASAAATHAGDPRQRVPKHRLILKLAVAATMLWSLALAGMAFLTANPPAISRDQLRRSDAVVTARLDKARPDRIRIERVLSGGLTADDVVTVLNLPEQSAFAAGELCVIPLSHFRRDYKVTMLEGQRAPPLIYRATPETMGAVKQILREANRE
jgi:hypothetical protein